MVIKKFILIISAILLAAGIVVLFGPKSFVKKGKDLIAPLGGKPGSVVDAKDAQNPITGILYTKEEAASWIDRRPLGVMINNHVDARPQSGLIDADIVYEVVAEGGITRYLAFFLTNIPEKIGPIRSTREYYLVIVKELGDALLMHIGWSPQALIDIESWPIRSLGRGGASFWRDNSRNVAYEHTAYTNGKELLKRADELGWQGKKEFKVWKFKDDFAVNKSGATANEVSVDFWTKGEYSTSWTYDGKTNTYMRYLGGGSHDDNESKKQLSAKNLIVLFAAEQRIQGDDKNRLDYTLIGSGTALVFIDGKVVKTTWSKAGRDDRTMFYDLDGNEIEFNRGNFWVSIVPDRNVDQVVYK